MPSLLSPRVKNVQASIQKSTTGGGSYLNPSSITEDTVRISFLTNPDPTAESSIAGYEVWVADAEGKRKGMRFSSEPTREDIAERAKEMKLEPVGDEKIKAFYAFAVWNYDTETVQVFQFSQQGLCDPITNYLSEEEIEAEPDTWDFKLGSTGQGLDKRYSVFALPGHRRKEPVAKKVNAAWEKVRDDGFDLTQLFAGGNPFKPTF